MTREEAIEVIKDIYNYTKWDTYITNEARTMAIKALEQEPCEDCISRQAVLDAITANCIWENEYNLTSSRIKKAVESLPLVNPQPKTGHWIFDEILDKHYYCSECKSMGVDYWDYCPYCGAKMVEPQETETWNGIQAQITAPKGTFERIFNDADDDNDI